MNFYQKSTIQIIGKRYFFAVFEFVFVSNSSLFFIFRKTVTDKQTGKDVVLPDEALATVSNVLKMRYPQVGYNPYQVKKQIESKNLLIRKI